MEISSRSQAPLGNATGEALLRELFVGTLKRTREAELRTRRSQAELGNEFIFLYLKTLESNHRSLLYCRFRRASGSPTTPGCGAAPGCVRPSHRGSRPGHSRTGCCGAKYLAPKARCTTCCLRPSCRRRKTGSSR